MGIVVRFPRRHVRVSSSLRAAKPAKTSNVISDFPSSAAKATTEAQWPAGIPRMRQLLTVESDCPKAPATAPVPPRATMIASELSIPDNIIRTMRTSQGFANCETTFIRKCDAIGSMEPDSDEAVGRRIIALREKANLQQQQLAKQLHMAKSTLAGYESGNRPLTVVVIRKIRRRFGVTVDWLMFGDMQVSGKSLMLEIGPEPDVPQHPSKKRKAG